MPPCIAAPDVIYHLPGNSVFACNDGSRSLVAENSEHLFVGELRITVRLAFCFVLTTLANHVRHIFLACTNPKMVWIDAGRNVTRMADLLAFRDKAFVKKIGQPVRWLAFALEIKDTIASLGMGAMESASPKDASIFIGRGGIESQFGCKIASVFRALPCRFGHAPTYQIEGR